MDVIKIGLFGFDQRKNSTNIGGHFQGVIMEVLSTLWLGCKGLFGRTESTFFARNNNK